MNMTKSHIVNTSFFILFSIVPTAALSETAVICSWTVMSEWRVDINNKVKSQATKPYIHKTLHTMSPMDCAKFDLSSPLPGQIPNSVVPRLFETYQAPNKFNLSCPSGYKPAQEISWGQTGGVERRYLDKSYYLDFYQARLPCIKE